MIPTRKPDNSDTDPLERDLWQERWERIEDILWDTWEWLASFIQGRSRLYKLCERCIDAVCKVHRGMERQGLSRAIYSGLAGQRPVWIRDMAGGKEARKSGEIFVLALTQRRLVTWRGRPNAPTDCGGLVRLRTNEQLLDDVLVLEEWPEKNKFKVSFIDRKTGKCVESWMAPDWSPPVIHIRPRIDQLRRREYFSRVHLPKWLLVAAIIAILADILLSILLKRC